MSYIQNYKQIISDEANNLRRESPLNDSRSYGGRRFGGNNNYSKYGDRNDDRDWGRKNDCGSKNRRNGGDFWPHKNNHRDNDRNDNQDWTRKNDHRNDDWTRKNDSNDDWTRNNDNNDDYTRNNDHRDNDRNDNQDWTRKNDHRNDDWTRNNDRIEDWTRKNDRNDDWTRNNDRKNDNVTKKDNQDWSRKDNRNSDRSYEKNYDRNDGRDWSRKKDDDGGDRSSFRKDDRNWNQSNRNNNDEWTNKNNQGKSNGDDWTTFNGKDDDKKNDENTYNNSSKNEFSKIEAKSNSFYEHENSTTSLSNFQTIKSFDSPREIDFDCYLTDHKFTNGNLVIRHIMFKLSVADQFKRLEQILDICSQDKVSLVIQQKEQMIVEQMKSVGVSVFDLTENTDVAKKLQEKHSVIQTPVSTFEFLAKNIEYLKFPTVVINFDLNWKAVKFLERYLCFKAQQYQTKRNVDVYHFGEIGSESCQQIIELFIENQENNMNQE